MRAITLALALSTFTPGVASAAWIDVEGMDGILHFNPQGLLLQLPLYSLDPNDRSEDPWDLPGLLTITAGPRVSVTTHDSDPHNISFDYDYGTASLEVVLPQGTLTGTIDRFAFTVFHGAMPDATPFQAAKVENVTLDAALASYIGSDAAKATFHWYADGFEYRAYDPPDGQMEGRIYHYNPFFRFAPLDGREPPCDVPAPGALVLITIALGWRSRRTTRQRHGQCDARRPGLETRREGPVVGRVVRNTVDDGAPGVPPSLRHTSRLRERC